MNGMEARQEPVLLAAREHRFAPPAWRMFDALTVELDAWLRLRPREMKPKIKVQARPELVVRSSLWPVSPDDEIEFWIRPDAAGSAVKFQWTSTKPPDERGIGLVRHQLNQAIAQDLRNWVDTGVPLS